LFDHVTSQTIDCSLTCHYPVEPLCRWQGLRATRASGHA
jgi:hypothetical protein